MIEVRGLVKSFGSRGVLRGVDLAVGAGEFVVLLGANGAGKTTLLRIVATLGRPTAGSIRLAGHETRGAGADLRRLVGYVSHRTLLYDDLTGLQNLRFYARLYDVPAPEARVGALMEQVGLWERRDEVVRAYSRGMQQRLAIARALLHDPPILLLDEPYTGLDGRAAGVLDSLLGGISPVGRAVLMTTHDLARALAVSSRVAVLSEGRIVSDLPTSELTPAALQSLYERHVSR